MWPQLKCNKERYDREYDLSLLLIRLQVVTTVISAGLALSLFSGKAKENKAKHIHLTHTLATVGPLLSSGS